MVQMAPSLAGYILTSEGTRQNAFWRLLRVKHNPFTNKHVAPLYKNKDLSEISEQPRLQVLCHGYILKEKSQCTGICSFTESDRGMFFLVSKVTLFH